MIRRVPPGWCPGCAASQVGRLRSKRSNFLHLVIVPPPSRPTAGDTRRDTEGPVVHVTTLVGGDCSCKGTNGVKKHTLRPSELRKREIAAVTSSVGRIKAEDRPPHADRTYLAVEKRQPTQE
jgi:hypothetical protein